MSRQGKRTVLHVNMHIARANAKTGAPDPAITVKTHDTNTYAHEGTVHAADGQPLARVIHRPDAPLADGSRIWIEAYAPVQPLNLDGTPAAPAIPGTPDHPVVIQVSKPGIRANIHADALAPVLTLTPPGAPAIQAHQAAIHGPNATELARITYRPAHPLACGARVWIETRQPVTTLIRNDIQVSAA